MTLSHLLRALRANAKLGWDQEGNWAPPLLYLLFALIAPIAGVLMLIFMYLVIKGGSTDQGFLAFLLAGSAMFLFIRLLLQGAGFAVVEDREHYRILRYIYIAPVPFPVQIAGRIVVKLIVSISGMLATFAAGYFFLGVQFRVDGIHWAWFFEALVGGLIGLLAISWILSSIMLLIDRMGWVWAEGLAGVMFLAAGAIIPLSLLPAPLVWLSKILPMTYWADLWRNALYGSISVFAQPQLSVAQLETGLWLSALGWSVSAIFIYRLCDYLARRWARIERETFY